MVYLSDMTIENRFEFHLNIYIGFLFFIFSNLILFGEIFYFQIIPIILREIEEKF